MAKTIDLQMWWSILSRKSEVMTVLKVLLRPCLTPLGGSLVTLTDLCSRPRGKPSFGSQDIQILKSGWIWEVKSSLESIPSRIFIIFIPR